MIKQYSFGWYEKDKKKGWIWHEVNVAGESFKEAFTSFKKEYGKKLLKGRKNGTIVQVMTWEIAKIRDDNVKIEIRRGV